MLPLDPRTDLKAAIAAATSLVRAGLEKAQKAELPELGGSPASVAELRTLVSLLRVLVKLEIEAASTSSIDWTLYTPEELDTLRALLSRQAV